MTPVKSVWVVVAAVALGFGIGGLSGALWIQRAMFTESADRDAWETIERVEVLSRLRLGQYTAAIDVLERSLADQVVFIASVHPPSASARDRASFRALLAAKAYTDVFPLTPDGGGNGGDLDTVLEKVPILQDSSRYTDGVNQLMQRYPRVPLAPALGT